MFPSLKIGNLEAELAIIQGGMAIKISTAPLASAVVNAGAIGVIGASGMTQEELRSEIRLAKHLISANATGALGVNIMLAVQEFQSLLKVCVEEKLELVFVGAGLAGKWVFEATKGTKTNIIPIISRAVGLKVLVERERVIPQAVVVESGEAGGHLGTNKSTEVVVTEVVEVAKRLDLNLPIVPAGGIRNGVEVKALEKLGATGAQVGTPFALTNEVREQAPRWQDVLLKATEELVFGGRHRPGSPTGYPARAVPNSAVRRLLRGGVTHLNEEKPNCGRSCLVRCAYRDTRFLESTCIFRRLVLAVEGNKEEGIFFVGKGIADLNTIVSAEMVVANIVKEYASSP